MHEIARILLPPVRNVGLGYLDTPPDHTHHAADPLVSLLKSHSYPEFVIHLHLLLRNFNSRSTGCRHNSKPLFGIDLSDLYSNLCIRLDADLGTLADDHTSSPIGLLLHFFIPIVITNPLGTALVPIFLHNSDPTYFLFRNWTVFAIFGYILVKLVAVVGPPFTFISASLILLEIALVHLGMPLMTEVSISAEYFIRIWKLKEISGWRRRQLRSCKLLKVAIGPFGYVRKQSRGAMFSKMFECALTLIITVGWPRKTFSHDSMGVTTKFGQSRPYGCDHENRSVTTLKGVPTKNVLHDFKGGADEKRSVTTLNGDGHENRSVTTLNGGAHEKRSSRL
ncbi:hypothetical protein Fcan01_27037 [Folsomia candida]|uniref:Uncharacterized protein n=1 Tax=Folsomia candida TaxID=158441 RepID=A0A226CZ81_FOLCA|nr:hypothetical protein Fcan01_27037 [Folsomia candida]